MTNRQVQILAIEAAKAAFAEYSGTDSMPQPSEAYQAYQAYLEARRKIFGDSGNNLIIDNNLQWRQFKSHYWMQLALEMWRDYKHEL